MLLCLDSALLQVLQPAIELAEEGFPLHPVSAYFWDMYISQITSQRCSGASSFLNSAGRAPKAGEIHKNPDLANTFRTLAQQGAAKGEPILNACQNSVGLKCMLPGRNPAET